MGTERGRPGDVPLQPGCPGGCCHAVGDAATAGKFGNGGLRVASGTKSGWQKTLGDAREEHGVDSQGWSFFQIVPGSFPGGVWGCYPGFWELKYGGKPLGDAWREYWMDP